MGAAFFVLIHSGMVAGAPMPNNQKEKDARLFSRRLPIPKEKPDLT
jgi:hypothetical protein